MPQLKRKIIAFTALLMLGVFFLSSSPALAASAKETLTADNWIILQVPIPFPGCSNAALKNNVKCCNEEIIKTYYAQTSSGLGQTYKSAAPICPLGSVAAVKDIPSLILVAVQFMTIVIIIMMVLLMIVSGIQYIVSFGNAEKAKKSLERVKHGAFGLVIVLFSSVILYQVNPKLLSLSMATPEGVTPAFGHCAEEGNTNCGEKVKGNDSCLGRKCQQKYYCAEKKTGDNVESLNCEAKLAIDTSCNTNDQCLSSFCAVGVNDPSKKVCTDIKIVLTKTCETNNDCQGLFCYKQSGSAGHCTFGHAANNCADNSQCDSGMGYECINSRCTIRTLYGICDESKNCPEGTICSEGTYYNTLGGQFGIDNGTKTCLPMSKNDPTTVTKVFACNNNDECKSSPFGTTYCSEPRGALIQTSKFCTLGTFGSPCINNSECSTKYCYTTAGICTNGASGDACKDNDQCSTGYCYINSISGVSNFCIDNPSSSSSAPALRNQIQQ